MAKVTKKKVGKMKVKKSKKVKKRLETSGDSSDEMQEESEDFTAVSEPVRYDDDDDDDEDLNPELSADEEEPDEEDERKRNKLVQAISSMGGGHRSARLEERSEAAVQVSEFGVTAAGEGSKVELSDLIPSATKKAHKQIETLQRRSKTLETPLSRQETERIHRDVAFQKVSDEVSKWKSVIRQNERSEQLVFPLNQEPSGPKPIEHVVTAWNTQTPLEQEIFALLNANKQPIHNPILTPAEEESLKAMSLEEAKIRRAELQKARALQSYYEAKARRERKIKSKKYHKVHNKAKRKEMLKQFDEMVKSNPEAALEELKKLEMARMQERMSLKHQNSGKWAKSKAIMAKYDEDARKAMQQQLELNKELTQKVVTALNNDDEEDDQGEDGEEEVLPDFVNEAEKAGDATNPWMRGKLTEEEREKEETAEMPDEAVVIEESSDEENEVKEEEVLLREFENRRQKRKEEEEDRMADQDDDDEEEEEEDVVAEDELSEFTSKIRSLPEKPEVEVIVDNSTPLEEGLTRIQTLEDAENLEVPEMSENVESDVVEIAQVEETAKEPPPKKAKKRKRNIELKEVLTKESKVVSVPLKLTTEEAGEEDLEEEMDQRGLIKEAFAGDDVVSDFLKEKRKQEEAGKPKVADLTLPGWGEWGGLGLKPLRRKRKKFRIKTQPAVQRKDAKLPAVIMSEQRDKSVASHQVNSLPFPFGDHTQFENTIRCPLGRTWNSEKTVKKVTQPRVVTQLGAIIEPMGHEELKKSQQSAGNQKSQTQTTKATNQKKTKPERRKQQAQKRKKRKQ
ncbi:U3 small nucleolar RNA-associated protein 14 homolog A [Boleophthalmus pectinirostris]|uniref:U3 small nucleolar RNA-associated protein 14 homolog A n=1 Tax=Boleophthalmus pectinirostris TaxID=150288 RepID=UPI00242BB21B|nr:U3 small nucleolar RNA-associated protein 14 homolog A [Boleophthalmus pectinirostris]